MYHVTNGPARWVFVQAANAPRGLGWFNLYCYEFEASDSWRLRGFVPIVESRYTNGLERWLNIQMNGEYAEAVFRGTVVFSVRSDKDSTRSAR